MQDTVYISTRTMASNLIAAEREEAQNAMIRLCDLASQHVAKAIRAQKIGEYECAFVNRQIAAVARQRANEWREWLLWLDTDQAHTEAGNYVAALVA